MTGAISVQCSCGQAAFTLRGEPAARAHCHCNACRDFYGTAILSATAWNPEAVQVERGEVASFTHPTRQMARTFCRACGETLFGTNRLGMRVVPNSLAARAAGGSLPEAWQPTMHLFYRHRIMDVDDALVKYLDGWDGPRWLAP